MGPHEIDRGALGLGRGRRATRSSAPTRRRPQLWETYLDGIRKAGSSIGAVIEVVADGVPAGLGAPIYAKLDADLAAALMSINAVKGVEIGDGFAAAALTGEENADEMRTGNDGKPRFLSNHAGGILGGISTGQPVVARFAVKPTTSILTPRRTVDRDGAETEIITKGRHDPCVGIRAVPVGEAMMACVLADHLLRHRAQVGDSSGTLDAVTILCFASRVVQSCPSRFREPMTRTLPAKNLREAEIAFPLPELAHLSDFVGIVGAPVWRERLAELQTRIAASNRQGSVLRQRHSLELALDRLLNRGPESRTKPPLSAAETRLALIAAECVTLAKQLTPEGRERLRERLQAALSDDNTLIDLFHLLRTGALYRERGFSVFYAKLEELASYDLLLSRDDVEAECVCDTVSAEIGRDIHRVAWARFCDLAEANLKAWLEGRPGRYLLKMTLTRGLTDAEPAMVTSLHDRLKTMLASGNRLDQDPNATLRLEPLSLAGTATTATEEGTHRPPASRIRTGGTPLGRRLLGRRLGHGGPCRQTQRNRRQRP